MAATVRWERACTGRLLLDGTRVFEEAEGIRQNLSSRRVFGHEFNDYSAFTALFRPHHAKPIATRQTTRGPYMNWPATLIGLAGSLMTVLGSIHLLYTLRGQRLEPTDPALIAAMRRTPMHITRETDMWRAWLGFNASHSLGAIGFGTLLVGVATSDARLFANHPLLAIWALLMVAGYLWIARTCWFSVPRRGLLIALCLLVTGLLALLLS
jgi:hypothetical protein